MTIGVFRQIFEYTKPGAGAAARTATRSTPARRKAARGPARPKTARRK
jgi:hypothetical protein